MLDEAAFAELYDRHAPPLAAWLRRRSDPDTAQELLAETFAEAWCGRRRFKPERGSPRAWLFGIAQNLLFGYYRRLEVEDRARRKLGVAALEPAVYDDADARLAGLAEGTREAVLLRVVEQLSYDELGRRLGCSSPAARLRVSRGLRELRRDRTPLLSPEGAVS
jgi:RNA polymerase sigma factor (sigma-70 family)